MAQILLGLALLTYGAIVLQRDRSRAGHLYGLSYVAGCLSLTLWPPSNSAVLDALTHVPGLGRLLNDTFATLSVVLQFAFISTLAGAWSRWRRRALAVYGVMLALLVPLWGLVRLSVTRDFTQLFYHGYYARPPALLAWNLLVGLAITYTCGLSFLGYARALGATRTRFTRATTTAAIVVYAVAAVYGVLVVAQLAADGLGFGPTGVLRYTGAIVIVCVLVTLGSTGVVVFGHTVGDYLRRWFSLSRKEAALAQLLKDNINANILVSDQRVYLARRANRTLVRAVDAHCRQHGVSTYQRKVARQATRFGLLERRLLRPIQREADADADPEAAEEDEQALLTDLSRHIAEDLSFFADAYRVARLVLLALRGDVWPEDRPPELERRREPPGWRREVAELIVDVVHAHLQEERQRRTMRKASVCRKPRRKIRHEGLSVRL